LRSTGADNSRSDGAERTKADLARRMAMTFERTTTDPEVLRGVPCIRGLRVPVTTMVGMVTHGMTSEEFLVDGSRPRRSSSRSCAKPGMMRSRSVRCSA
jgi:hypothetical protein